MRASGRDLAAAFAPPMKSTSILTAALAFSLLVNFVRWARSARFGTLSDEKIALSEKVERDYGEVYWQQRRGAGNEDAMDTFEGRNRSA